MRTITVTHEIDCEAEYCGKCEEKRQIGVGLDYRCKQFKKKLTNETKETEKDVWTLFVKRLPECIKAETNSSEKPNSSNIRS